MSWAGTALNSRQGRLCNNSTMLQTTSALGCRCCSDWESQVATQHTAHDAGLVCSALHLGAAPVGGGRGGAGRSTGSPASSAACTTSKPGPGSKRSTSSAAPQPGPCTAASSSLQMDGRGVELPEQLLACEATAHSTASHERQAALTLGLHMLPRLALVQEVTCRPAGKATGADTLAWLA